MISEYEDDLRHDRLFLPSCVILEHNWRDLSSWAKLKYLIFNKFDKDEAKICASIDYYKRKNYGNSYKS